MTSITWSLVARGGVLRRAVSGPFTSGMLAVEKVGTLAPGPASRLVSSASSVRLRRSSYSAIPAAATTAPTVPSAVMIVAHSGPPPAAITTAESARHAGEPTPEPPASPTRQPTVPPQRLIAAPP